MTREKGMVKINNVMNSIRPMPLPQLLIATHKLDDSAFAKHVILLHQHDDYGSEGVVINQPLEAEVGAVFEQLNIESNLNAIKQQKLYLGGPVERDQGLILSLEALQPQKDSAQSPEKSIAIDSKQKVLEDIANGKGPKNFLIALGHTVWEGGQLEEELAKGFWIQRPVSSQLLFETPVKDRWLLASQQIGLDMGRMTHFVGHD